MYKLMARYVKLEEVRWYYRHANETVKAKGNNPKQIKVNINDEETPEAVSRSRDMFHNKNTYIKY